MHENNPRTPFAFNITGATAPTFKEFTDAQTLATHVYSIAMHARQIRTSFTGSEAANDLVKYDEFVSVLISYLAPNMDPRVLTLVKAYVLARGDGAMGGKPTPR